MTDSLRHGKRARNSAAIAKDATPRQPTDDVRELAQRLGRYEAAVQHTELGDRERLMLHAYVHYESVHGGPIGLPGVCWPTDQELATYLGRDIVTARRGRRRLTRPENGAEPYIAVRYVPPFHRLPNGDVAPHGANVITILEMTPRRKPTPNALQDANAEVLALERQLEAARARARELGGAVEEDRAAQSTDAQGANRQTSHNAPWMTTPEWSRPRSPVAVTWTARGGEPIGCSLH